MKKLTLLLFTTTTFSSLFFLYCLCCLQTYTLVLCKSSEADDFSSSVLWPGEQRADIADFFQKTLVGLGLKGDKKMMRVINRRLLNEPGSSPPQCISKCGSCMPCKPVHVAVPPGTPVTEEYYPEAWRCKCGNRLYMP